jgi:tRNA A-37 threonylcarbamoyl transferase component Bud32
MRKAQQLGRYLLLDRIAFGGMAEIYRAKTFDREGRVHLVAVKRVLNHLTSDDEFIKMLVDEAKITATLKHDNIARLYEFAHTEDDEYFMAMEWVDGKDVRSLLERHRARKQPIPPEHAAWIIMEVAHALNAAHAQRDSEGRAMHIVHRDVSPSNVLCSYAGEVKLCDFGIAKATSTRVQTKTGVIKGKVKYMSPEQALGRRLDHRSDLFSLGSVLYEMLTLEAPFQAPTEVELIFAVRDAQKRDARTIVPSLPEELNAIVNRAMMRSRSARYQSGREMATALRQFLDHYRPGYRRSHFGRFMRQEFAAEIEKELRQLEEFVIDDVEPTKVGENLIADALGPDAPYTQFTAASTMHGVGELDHVEPGPRARRPANGDAEFTPRAVPIEEEPAPLHVEPTRILGAEGPPVGDLHVEPTRILMPPSSPPPPSPLPSASPSATVDLGLPLDLPNAPTQAKVSPLPAPPPARDPSPLPLPPPPVAGAVGGVLAMPGVPPPEAPPLPPLAARPTQVIERPAFPALHSLETRIIRMPPAERKVVVAFEDEDEDEDTTSVPLADDDLEEA